MRMVQRVPMSPTPSFPYSCHLTLVSFIVTTNEPVLMHLYSLKSIFYSDFLMFYCSRIPSRTPHDISAFHLLGLFLTVTVSQTLFALMILMVFRSSGQVFVDSPSWTLCHVVS